MDGYADLHTNHIYTCHAWYCGANICQAQVDAHCIEQQQVRYRRYELNVSMFVEKFICMMVYEAIT